MGVLVTGAALLFGLGFGLNFGVSNENTYLVGGLHLLHPGILAHDWLVTRTTPYHRLFAYPVAALLYLDSSGWLFAIVNVIFVALGAVIVFKLLQRITASPDQPLPSGSQPLPSAGQPLPFAGQLLSLVLVLLMSLATLTLSVGDSTVYTLTFDPATVGVTGFLLGMYLFVRERYLLSGVALAAGGIFHPNYLILSFPVFLLAHLVLRRRRVGRALLRQFAVPVAALLALLPIIVPIALQPGSAGTGILLAIRSPHHYEPLTFRDEFVPFLGWLLLFGAGLRRTDVRKDPFSPAVALAATMTALVALGTALTTFVYVPSVAQAYVWRLAPLVVLLAQMFAVRMVVGGDGGARRAPGAGAAPEAGAGAAPGAKGAPGAAPASEHEAGSRWLLPPVWRTLFVLVAAECLGLYYYSWHRDWLVLEVLGGVAVLGLLAWAARQPGVVARLRRPAAFGRHAALAPHAAPWRPRALARPEGSWLPAALVAIVAGAGLALVAADGLTGNSNLLAAATPESQLYSWARTATNPDAVFLIPPDMDNFRLSSQRAVVVDWKSTPFAPAELEEWYRRLDALTGRTHPRTSAQAAEGFAKLNGRRLATIADMYVASYVVLREPLVSAPPASAPPASWQVAFDNGRYRVLRTGVRAP